MEIRETCCHPAGGHFRTGSRRSARVRTGIAGDAPLVVVGNLPYYITSDILLHLFAQADSISRAVVMVQEEVADRLAASAGTSAYGVLSATAQMHGRVEKLFALPPEAFTPAPGVSSAVVRFDMNPRFEDLHVDAKTIHAISATCFRQKRKTLVNNLKSAGVADTCRYCCSDRRRRTQPGCSRRSRLAGSDGVDLSAADQRRVNKKADDLLAGFLHFQSQFQLVMATTATTNATPASARVAATAASADCSASTVEAAAAGCAMTATAAGSSMESTTAGGPVEPTASRATMVSATTVERRTVGVDGSMGSIRSTLSKVVAVLKGCRIHSTRVVVEG